jgi:outer membrane lipase/esterase
MLKRKPARCLLAAALALAAAPVLAEGPFTQTVFFGDSLSDSGFFRPALVQQAGPSAALAGRFTTNPGLVWAEYLANYYGTDASPAWSTNGATVTNGTGTNFAIGGARTGVTSGASLSMTTQVGAYLARNAGVADPNALYTVWGGANDLFAVAAGAPAQTTIANAVTSQIGVVGALSNAGARYILVPTIPDLGITPSFRAQGATASATATGLATTYNNALFGGLATAGYRFIPLDTFHLLQEIVANPSAYGIANVTGTACNPQITASSLTCTPLNYAAPGADQSYAFADGVHPSSRAHSILAGYAISTIEAPRQMALLPNSASMVGRSRAERVAAHATAGDADGMEFWADLRGDFQRYDHGNVYDGAGPTLTFGVDWTSGNLVYGAFAGYGRQAQDFGQHRGSFDQSDASVGGFVGWYGDNGGWVNGQVSWSQVDFDIDREVVLGNAVRRHSSSADGENLSAGVSAGWEFGEGALRHGPVLGALMQRIDIDAFAEDQPTLSTSLAYPEQSFDSMIGSIGWQATYTINEHFKPYARLTVDREFEDAPAEAWAQMQSMPGTEPFAVPGVGFDQDYSTLTFGARTTLMGFDANVGTSLTVGQKNANHATVFVTVGF